MYTHNFKNYLVNTLFSPVTLTRKLSSWGECFSTNLRGRTLKNLIDNSNMKILPPTYSTYWISDQNILGIFVAKFPSNCNTNASNINGPSLDYSPVILDFEMVFSNSSINPQAPDKISGFSF